MDKKQFGQFFKESRLKKNYTQKDIANQLYVDVTAVSKWERGISYPDITLIPDICKLLDVTEHELIEASKDSKYHKMEHDAKVYNKTKNTIFLVSSICYLVAILTCFICNLAISHKLDWFFIVLTSCLVGFSFCPTILRFFSKRKLIIFVASTFLSLFVLYLTCSIYTNNYWFMIATMGTLLGYFAFFFPFIFKNKKLFLLIYALGLYLLTILLLLTIPNIDLQYALIITSYCYSLLVLYGLINLIRIHKFFRIGIDSFLTTIYYFGLFFQTFFWSQDFSINFADWANYTNGNVCLILMIITIVVGIIFLILGIRQIFAQKDKNK